ncbi:MAG: DUF116 domain-containing protein [bacterium]|nr:DUF116 domain-containing protein [bacterium]
MKWRFPDTGRLSATANITLDDVLLETQARGLAPRTVRLLQFEPAAELVGYHQSLREEVRLDFCRQAGIDVNRRLTGGGAIFFDASQIGWEIICDKDFFGAGVAGPGLFRRFSEPIIKALNELGLDARFRPRNDVEIDGRKISGTGGTEREGAFLFQGTLLVDFDVETMMRALRIPIEKLEKRELASAQDRVTYLKRELGYVPDRASLKRLIKESFEATFGTELVESGLTDEEQRLFDERLANYESADWIDKVRLPAGERPTVVVNHMTPGGLIKALFAVDTRAEVIRSALFTGDFFVYPQRAIFDLEALLKDAPLDENILAGKIAKFFETEKVNIPAVGPGDFVAIIAQAREKLKLLDLGVPAEQVNDVFVVCSPFTEILEKTPGTLLLPYCAKPLECEYRYTKECVECEGCGIGDAYRLARERGLDVTTITNFEDLIETLGRLRENGADSYIGCCCESFYVKHMKDFEAAGLPGVLLNIDNETCFDLGKMSDAYEGRFESETALNVRLLEKILDVVL